MSTPTSLTANAPTALYQLLSRQSLKNALIFVGAIAIFLFIENAQEKIL